MHFAQLSASRRNRTLRTLSAVFTMISVIRKLSRIGVCLELEIVGVRVLNVLFRGFSAFAYSFCVLERPEEDSSVGSKRCRVFG